MYDFFIALLWACLCSTPNPPAQTQVVIHPMSYYQLDHGGFRPQADQDTTGNGGDDTGGEGGHVPPGE